MAAKQIQGLPMPDVSSGAPPPEEWTRAWESCVDLVDGVAPTDLEQVRCGVGTRRERQRDRETERQRDIEHAHARTHARTHAHTHAVRNLWFTCWTHYFPFFWQTL